MASRHRATRAEGEEVHGLGRYYRLEGGTTADKRYCCSLQPLENREGNELSSSWSGRRSGTTADKWYYHALLPFLLPLPCVVLYGNPTRKIETTAGAVVPAALTSGTIADRRYYPPGRGTTA